MGERNALLRGVETQVQVTRQLFGRGPDFVVIKYHRQTRERPETLAADARGQEHAAQIYRHRADRADAVEAELEPVLRRYCLEQVRVVQHTGGSFAVHGPEPLASARRRQLPTE